MLADNYPLISQDGQCGFKWACQFHRAEVFIGLFWPWTSWCLIDTVYSMRPAGSVSASKDQPTLTRLARVFIRAPRETKRTRASFSLESNKQFSGCQNRVCIWSERKWSALFSSLLVFTQFDVETNRNGGDTEAKRIEKEIWRPSFDRKTLSNERNYSNNLLPIWSL